jgi:hypothetical protein
MATLITEKIAGDDDLWVVSAHDKDIIELFGNPEKFVMGLTRPSGGSYKLNDLDSKVTIVVAYDSSRDDFIVQGVHTTSLIRISAPKSRLEARMLGNSTTKKVDESVTQEDSIEARLAPGDLETLFEEPDKPSGGIPTQDKLCFLHENPSYIKSELGIYLSSAVNIALTPHTFLARLATLSVENPNGDYKIKFKPLPTTFSFTAVVPRNGVPDFISDRNFTGVTQPCNKIAGTVTNYNPDTHVVEILVNGVWVAAYYPQSNLREEGGSDNSFLDTSTRGTLIKRKITIKETYQP